MRQTNGPFKIVMGERRYGIVVKRCPQGEQGCAQAKLHVCYLYLVLV